MVIFIPVDVADIKKMTGSLISLVFCSDEALVVNVVHGCGCQDGLCY